MAYVIVKWFHVVAAILAVGSNATYGLWIARASGKPDTLPFILRGIKQIDDRLANPSYGLLLLTGLIMVYVGKLSLATPWLLTGVSLYVILVLVGLIGYTPTLREQIRLIEQEGTDSPAYQAAARRGLGLGILVGVLALVIVFMMVVKPRLWG